MHQIKVQHLLDILLQSDLPLDVDFHLEVNSSYLKDKGEALLNNVIGELKGQGNLPILIHLKFDFKINRNLFVYDDAVHFNRYRLTTLKSDLYSTFSFSWVDGYKRLCRTFEKECIKAGLQDRIWNGPPIASRIFGKSEEPGDLSGNGSSGWKLNAYNDAQYDLISRLHGYKLIRIPEYENIMIGGSLKKIDDLLLNPKEEYQRAILNWVSRKVQI
ncbi:hypothetical protein [Aquiflexum sp.]|uniref:DUF7255 family protein n=1 Tax=Aquiflexum sp. TaxID=1872584 RepID=UPI003593B1D7